MATPPNQQTANADSTAAMADLVTKANQVFIDATTQLINNAILLGQFQVTVHMVPHSSFTDISTYFQGLGYTLYTPRYQYADWTYWQYGLYWFAPFPGEYGYPNTGPCVYPPGNAAFLNYCTYNMICPPGVLDWPITISWQYPTAP